MDVATFSLYHPVAYRRVLVGICVVLVLAGVGTSLAPVVRAARQAGALSQTPSPLPTPTSWARVSMAPPQLTQLPGNDGTGAAAPVPVGEAPTASNEALALGQIMNQARFGNGQWSALDALWNRESHWNPAARSGSGACGIPQALPCSKITDMSTAGQIAWGLGYIAARYGTPSNAWAHEERFGWY